MGGQFNSPALLSPSSSVLSAPPALCDPSSLYSPLATQHTHSFIYPTINITMASCILDHAQPLPDMTGEQVASVAKKRVCPLFPITSFIQLNFLFSLKLSSFVQQAFLLQLFIMYHYTPAPTPGAALLFLSPFQPLKILLPSLHPALDLLPALALGLTLTIVVAHLSLLVQSLQTLWVSR